MYYFRLQTKYGTIIVFRGGDTVYLSVAYRIAERSRESIIGQRDDEMYLLRIER